MEYLSFDIECCDGRHICEFGYVRFDEEFHVIEKECWLINPEWRITLSGKKSRGDMTLHFSDKEYKSAPKFPHYYDRIRDLLYAKNVRIVGFSLQNDCGFLKTACERYQLPPLKFGYLDFQKLYRGYTKAKQDVSVGKFSEELAIDGIAFHKSDDDAYAVVLGLKKIAERENLSLPETLHLLEDKEKEYREEQTLEKAKRHLKKIFDGNKKMQNGFLNRYSQKVEKNKESADPIFANKWVCIGSSYQNAHFSEFVGLVALLAGHGASYTPRTSSCSVFIVYDVENDARYKSAQACANGGKNILFLPLSEALEKLGSSEEDLLSFDLYKVYMENKPEPREVKTSDGGATVKDLVSSNGQRKKRRRRGGRKHRKNPRTEPNPQKTE